MQERVQAAIERAQRLADRIGSADWNMDARVASHVGRRTGVSPQAIAYRAFGSEAMQWVVRNERGQW